MILAIMYSALGFLLATLLALLILPAVWRRAVRLTTKRIEGAIPVSMAEIQADKDQLRAEFAMSARRLEHDADLLRERTVAQFEQLSKQGAELFQLRTERDASIARMAELETANAGFAEVAIRHVDELAERDGAFAALSTAHGTAQQHLAAVIDQFNEATGLSDSLRVENVALTAEADGLRDQIADLQRELAATQALLGDDRGSLRQAIETLGTERLRAEELGGRLTEVEAALAASRAEAEALTQHVAQLEARALELSSRAGGSEDAHRTAQAELARIAGEAAAAKQEADGVARQLRDSIEMLRAEKTMLEGALTQVREDRARLSSALETRPAEAANGAMAAEPSAADAMLRDRLSDIAAEVVHMTAVLEGPDSPIRAILAANDENRESEASPTTAPTAAPTLADRIRAIQNRARR
jgi:DNA repair exonuclease SbcCD ATPase subunit